jgi:hypothetical protein
MTLELCLRRAGQVLGPSAKQTKEEPFFPSGPSIPYSVGKKFYEMVLIENLMK